MATLQQLERALVNADKAGDYDAARRLANAIVQARNERKYNLPEDFEEMILPGTIPEPVAPSLGEKMVGVGETALALGTGATTGTLGMIGGTLKGLAEQILSGQFGTNQAAQMVQQSAMQGAEEWTRSPRTETGQAYTKAVGNALAQAIPVMPLTAEMGMLGAGIKAAAPVVATVARGAVTRPKAPDARMGPIFEMVEEPIPAQPAPAAVNAVPDEPIPGQSVPENPATPPASPVSQKAFDDVGTLVRKASGEGRGSAIAKARLADLSQVNPEARAAAERLGLDLPFDVFSDSPQIREAVGLTRSVAGSEEAAAWSTTVRDATLKVDDFLQKFDAAYIDGRPAPGVTSQRILDNLTNLQAQLAKDASIIYQRVNATVPKQAVVQFPKLRQTLDEVLSEVGEKGFTSSEKRLHELASDKTATYGRLLREKDLVGQAVAGMKSPYGNMDAASLKRLYSALAEDQLTNVGIIGGEGLRKELRGANFLTAKKKALETRIIGAFGREIDGSVATLMQSAIKSASKGDAAQFHKLIRVVPPELRKETVATALASVVSSGRASQEGAFGFAEFAKTYRGLRSNPPVYKQVVEILGKESEASLRDLYDVSRRITDVRAQVLTTGKANQALVASMHAEGLIGKVMQSATAQRIVTGIAGAIPGGGFVAPDIVKFMSKGNSDAVNAAGKLFASAEFQKLAIEAATKAKPSTETLRSTAMSKQFMDFANKIGLPQSLEKRVQWLRAASQEELPMDPDNQ